MRLYYFRSKREGWLGWQHINKRKLKLDFYFLTMTLGERVGVIWGLLLQNLTLTLCLSILARYSRSVLPDIPPWATSTFWSTMVARGNQLKTSSNNRTTFVAWSCQLNNDLFTEVFMLTLIRGRNIFKTFYLIMLLASNFYYFHKKSATERAALPCINYFADSYATVIRFFTDCLRSTREGHVLTRVCPSMILSVHT